MRMKKVLYTVLAATIGTALFTGYSKANCSEASVIENGSGVRHLVGARI